MIVIGIIVATILNCVLGMLWYSPLVLGNIWAKAYRFNPKEHKCTSWHYVGSVAISLVTAAVLSLFVHHFKVVAWERAAMLSLCIWVGFIVTSQFSGVIWAKKPVKVYFIDIAYSLISLVIMGIVITLLR